jgi:hypothetical protein
MITSEEIVADGYDIVNSASCREKQHHKGQREDYRSVILVYPGIEGIHESLLLTAIAASSAQLT